jgi:hypothetical protein
VGARSHAAQPLPGRHAKRPSTRQGPEGVVLHVRAPLEAKMGGAFRHAGCEWAPTRRRLGLTVTGGEPWARDMPRPKQRPDHHGRLTYTDV